MEKIKNLNDVILCGDMMLGELKKPKRYILMPDGSRDEDNYIVIIKVGPSVNDLATGDLIIKMGGGGTGFKVKDAKGEEREYVVLSRYSVLIAVKPENFIDPDKMTEKIAI